MADLECPYCDAELEVCHDDGFGCDEGVAHEMECHECEKKFVFYTSISFDYETQKAECLNGSDHKWKHHEYMEHQGWPDWKTCEWCGREERGRYVRMEGYCPECGYTERDATLHGDHHLCKNAGNAPWEAGEGLQ